VAVLLLGAAVLSLTLMGLRSEVSETWEAPLEFVLRWEAPNAVEGTREEREIMTKNRTKENVTKPPMFR